MNHRNTIRAVALAGTACLLALLGACKPTQFEAASDIPAPLIERIPVVVALHVPQEFREKVYKEKRTGGQYEIALGKAQTDGFLRMMQAMFLRTVVVDTPASATQADAEVRGVLEPVLEDYAFVTPGDSGTDAYAVSLRYTINLYSTKGELVDSWTFTGYGTQPAGSLGGGDDALKAATAHAMRDAAAKLVAEFRDQAIARGLLAPSGTPVPSEVTAPTPP